VLSIGRPDTSVASQAKTWMALGIATMKLASEMKLSVMSGRPTANMWWTQTPNPISATPSSPMTMYV
jgi:hypothetical protein